MPEVERSIDRTNETGRMIPVGQGINGAAQLVYQPSFLPVVFELLRRRKRDVCLSDDAGIGLWIGMGSNLATSLLKEEN